jgi:YfiH family protein
MLIHKDPSFTIFFGDARQKIVPSSLQSKNLSCSLDASLLQVKKALECSSLVFLHQTHSDKGVALRSADQAQAMPSFEQEGDFLVTDVSRAGIAIATADCLPIVLYDTFNHVISVVHAGWRGSCKQVVVAAVERMEQVFSTQRAHIKVFFGPGARACCYEIKEDVLERLEQFSFAQEVVNRVNGRLFLDVALLNKLQLLHAGFKKEAIRMNYSLCTICDVSYCSYRRQGTPDRQMTVACLR